MALEKNHHPSSLKNKSVKELRPKLRATLIPVMKAAAEGYIPVDPVNLPCPSVDILLAGITNEKPWLLEIARNGGDMQHEDQGFFAIGSGEVFARYAYQSLLHLGISDRTLYECQMVAYRVIRTAIDTAAYGLGGEIQMMLVKKDGRVAELTHPEISAIRDTVGLWQTAEAESLGGIAAKPRTEEDAGEQQP